MAGLKIRIQPGAIYAETYKQLGAIPVAIDITEVYVAMSQGAVQAIETPMISMVANKMQEIVKVTSETNIDYNAGALMVGKRRFDGFTPDQQKAVRDAAHAMSAYWRADVAAATDRAAATMKAAGVSDRRRRRRRLRQGHPADLRQVPPRDRRRAGGRGLKQTGAA